MNEVKQNHSTIELQPKYRDEDYEKQAAEKIKQVARKSKQRQQDSINKVFSSENLVGRKFFHALE